MKYFSLFFLCLANIFSLSLFSQNFPVQYKECDNCRTSPENDVEATNYTYGGLNTFQTNQISSDYGPRRLGADHYDWHGGVDYTSQGGDADRGDLLIAIQGGDVILNVDGNYKRIYIDNADYDFGYGHIFWRTTSFPVISGECALKKMLFPHTEQTALIIPVFDIQGNVIGHAAIGEMPGQVVFENETIDVQTTVAAGDIIGPIGDSYSSTGNLDAHLHLYSFPNNNFDESDAVTKDPLEFVNHDAPNYDTKIIQQDGTEGITLTYPGTTNSSIRVRPRMPDEANGVSVYQNNTMNIDEVRVLMKKSFQDDSHYAPIQGPTYESRISHGVRINSVRYPADIIEDGPTPPAHVGNWTRQGIAPYAYADAASFPWDYFYFSDFATRVHSDDEPGMPAQYADCPQNARYNDGKYHIYVEVTDVQNTTRTAYYTNPLEITLDNFQPFIQQVTADSAGHPIYEKEWKCVENCSGATGGIQLVNPLPNPVCPYALLVQGGTITVNVVSSEPLQSLLLDVPELNLTGLGPVDQPADGINWEFAVPFGPSQLLQVNQIQFGFQGSDLSGNELLNLFTPGPLSSCVVLPVRLANGWSSSGLGTPQSLKVMC